MSHVLLKELKDKIQEADQIKAKLVEDLKPKFKEIFEPIFAKWPELFAIKWNQYTPYFNDGETCYFGVNNLDFALKGFDGNEEDTEDASDWSFDDIFCDFYLKDEDDYCVKFRTQATETFGSLDRYKEFKADQEAVQKEFRDLPEDVLQDLFGDHAEIIVTRKGLDVTEYEHD